MSEQVRQQEGPPCLDCGRPLTHHPWSDAYETRGFSNCYLCPFCRKHRYESEGLALARCQAGLERRAAASPEPKKGGEGE